MGINRFFTILVVAAIAILMTLSLYEIFLRPPEEIPAGAIDPISTYYGEDIFDFLRSR